MRKELIFIEKGFEKRFNRGDIIYFVENKGKEPFVKFGMVDEQFSDKVCIDYLEAKENRLVNGIKIDEFENWEKPKKLPKGWTWNTRLFEITYEERSKEVDNKMAQILLNNRIDNPKDIKTLYEKGYFVKKSTIFSGTIEAIVDKDGYKLVKYLPPYEIVHNGTSIRSDEVYSTYEEAKSKADEYTAELKRQAALTDAEWSMELIDNEIKKWIHFEDVSESRAKKVYEFFKSFGDKIENVEARFVGQGLQWRYWKNKKWNTIDY